MEINSKIKNNLMTKLYDELGAPGAKD